jgi:hypothetical protein
MAQRTIPLAAAATIGLYADGDKSLRSLTNGAKVIAMLWAIAYCHHKLGHYPTQAEYSKYWEIDERTAQREWALFRRAFPEEQSPERLARWVLTEISSRIEDKTAAMTVSAPADLHLAAA